MTRSTRSFETFTNHDEMAMYAAGWKVGNAVAVIDYGDGVRARLKLVGTHTLVENKPAVIHGAAGFSVIHDGREVARGTAYQDACNASHQRHVLVAAGNAEAYALRYLATLIPWQRAYTLRRRGRHSLTPSGRLVTRANPYDARVRSGHISVRREPTVPNEIENQIETLP